MLGVLYSVTFDIVPRYSVWRWREEVVVGMDGRNIPKLFERDSDKITIQAVYNPLAGFALRQLKDHVEFVGEEKENPHDVMSGEVATILRYIPQLVD